ncbi:MAG: hypothetical protein Tsb005_11170 [Gammaproteobacteria bacterium]
MFKGIESILNKAAKKDNQESVDRQLIPIVDATKLLAETKRAQQLQKLPALMNLDTEAFAKHCTQLINNFARFVQELPETLNSYYCKRGGMLDHGIDRAVLAASLCRAYFLPKDPERNSLNHIQIQWTYAVFSAALLNGIGKIAVDLLVTVHDEKTQASTHWLPYKSNMCDEGTHYKYEFSPLNQDVFRKRVTALLARQLMPTESFLWIASNEDILSAWLAMLEDDERGSGTLGPIIPHADAIVIERYFNQQMPEIVPADTVEISDPFQAPTDNSKPTSDAKTLQQPGSEMGHEFLRWLRRTLGAHKDITAAQTQFNVYAVQEGLFIGIEALKEFAEQRLGNANEWQKVAHEVSKLGLTETHPREQNNLFQYIKLDNPNAVMATNQSAQATKQSAEIIRGMVANHTARQLFNQVLSPEIQAQHVARVPLGVLQPQAVQRPQATAGNVQTTQSQQATQATQTASQNPEPPPSTPTPGRGPTR